MVREARFRRATVAATQRRSSRQFLSSRHVHTRALCAHYDSMRRERLGSPAVNMPALASVRENRYTGLLLLVAASCVYVCMVFSAVFRRTSCSPYDDRCVEEGRARKVVGSVKFRSDDRGMEVQRNVLFFFLQ